jgi:hypothetical protein
MKQLYLRGFSFSGKIVGIYSIAILIFSLISFVYTDNLQAQNKYYILSDASGAKDGSDWVNAYSSLPKRLVRGAIYYIGDGNYGSYSFNDEESGSAYITIKKATASDHGTNTGWSASYGDDQAKFGVLSFDNDYYEFNGQTGGGPRSWGTGFGFVVDTDSKVMIRLNGKRRNIAIRHTDVEGISRSSQVGQWGIYAVSGGSNITLDHCRFYNQQKVNVALYHVVDSTIKYCQIGPNGKGGVKYADGKEMHKIGLSLRNNRNITVKYNLLKDISETAYLGMVVDSPGEVQENLKVFGNIFYDSRSLPGTACSFTISFAVKNTTLSGFEFYNNVVANMSGSSNAGVYSRAKSGGKNRAYNNIFYNNITRSLQLQYTTNDYNFYSRNKTSDGRSRDIMDESNGQVESANPFKNMSKLNFELVSPTDQGKSLPSPYNEDMKKNTRGSDNNWDRGAIEFNGQNSENYIPGLPSSLKITEG